MVVRLPSGMTHFVVLWRLHGDWVQVMDPARGRRWVRRRELLREIYLHENRVPAEAFREWAETDGFRDPLLAPPARAGRAPAARPLSTQALADPGWQGVAALEAATRASEALIDRRASVPGGRRRRCEALFADVRQSPPGQSLLGARSLDGAARPPTIPSS